MWGKERCFRLRGLPPGITPTHVGKSSQSNTRYNISKDHPHPCGEKFNYPLHSTDSRGSPPPMWGKAPCMTASAPGARITPTHVGKRWSGRAPWSGRRDHPHPCGEKSARQLVRYEVPGSPPPMWGKVDLGAGLRLWFRITPTHVGKSVPESLSPSPARDHPHPCGEKLPRQRRPAPRLGSPPPMWGKAGDVGERAADQGITPTHVGKRLNKS